MMLSLRGLGEYQIEAFARSVEAEMERLGYDARLKDAIGPDVSVCMLRPGKPELCTDLRESGQPWVIYSPSNIANLQSERYQSMYGDGQSTSPATKPPATSVSIKPASLSFSNDTTGNQSLLRVGDSWTLVLTGEPNTQVRSIGGANGRRDSAVHGYTNASGVLRISGRVGTGEIGNWSQDFYVGSSNAGTLVFQVLAAEPKSTTTDEGKSTAEKLADEAKTAIPTDWMAWAKENSLLLVGGAAAVFFLMRGSK